MDFFALQIGGRADAPPNLAHLLMKPIITSVLLLLMTLPVWGQSDSLILDQVDVPPSFPGGEEALNRYVFSHLKYPRGEMAGTVYVRFGVDAQGKIVNAAVEKGLGPAWDEEALRLVRDMPQWEPARVAGKAVFCNMILPIAYEAENLLICGFGDEGEPEVFSDPETPPSFPGGDKALYEYIAEQMRYPEAAREQGLEGRVYVRFVVTKQGEITEAEVVRGEHEVLNQEALRLVRGMPRWEPGLYYKVPKDHSMIIPIFFRL